MEHHEALDRGPHEKTYLDVGANLGYFSLVAATHGFKVTAFEVSTKASRHTAIPMDCKPRCNVSLLAPGNETQR